MTSNYPLACSCDDSVGLTNYRILNPPQFISERYKCGRTSVKESSCGKSRRARQTRKRKLTRPSSEDEVTEKSQDSHGMANNCERNINRQGSRERGDFVF